MLMRVLVFIVMGLIAYLHADPVYQEKGGIIAMEAESTKSRLGDWKKKTDVEGFMGDCHLEFTGNTTLNGPAESPLKYEFIISKGGVYQLTLRARKRLETKREDISNDCYVAVKGDFESGGNVPLKVLKADTKMYGGNAESWGWARQLDVSHKKYDAKYLFKAGEKYVLTIHGRSKNFNIDRILLVHEEVGLRRAQQENPEESARVDGEGPEGLGSKIKPLVERVLTNREGRTVVAKLVSKKGDQLVVIIKGRRHDLSISDLSKEDQDFLKAWQP